ncbi:MULTISPECIES: hypothetical protein [unclassified Aerococcus]|uniref:hypothetical protein n=1 Tax=unclassified Aerococcus TaxID=2618060 RepID=UPI0025BDF0A3|nr:MULTISPECIES: hypothetical protein [unclassified Aerococcus]
MKMRKQNWLTLIFLAVIAGVSLFVWLRVGTFKPVKVTSVNSEASGQETQVSSLYLSTEDDSNSINWIPLSRRGDVLIPTINDSYGMFTSQVQDAVYKKFSLFDRPNLSNARLILEDDDLQLWQADTLLGDNKAQLDLTLIQKNDEGNWTYTTPSFQLDQADRTGNTLMSIAEDDTTIYLVYAFLQDYDQADYLKTFELNKADGEITEVATMDNASYELYLGSVDGLSRNPKYHLLPIAATNNEDSEDYISPTTYEIINPTNGNKQFMDTSSLVSALEEQSGETDLTPMIIEDKIFVLTNNYVENDYGSYPSQLSIYAYDMESQNFDQIWQSDLEQASDYYIDNGYIFQTIADGKTGQLQRVDIATGETTTVEEYTIEENSPYSFAKITSVEEQQFLQ